MTLPTTFYDPALAQWPDLATAGATLKPVGVGMDRRTGRLLSGWAHTHQSMAMIFETRFHERVLRRWVGSFVPHILGESAVPRIILRFYWAIASAIDLWEPRYGIQRVSIASPDDSSDAKTSAEELRLGGITTQVMGVFRPRGHLGDPTPEQRRIGGFVGTLSGWGLVARGAMTTSRFAVIIPEQLPPMAVLEKI